MTMSKDELMAIVMEPITEPPTRGYEWADVLAALETFGDKLGHHLRMRRDRTTLLELACTQAIAQLTEMGIQKPRKMVRQARQYAEDYWKRVGWKRVRKGGTS
jgi:hypothetical protein